MWVLRLHSLRTTALKGNDGNGNYSNSQGWTKGSGYKAPRKNTHDIVDMGLGTDWSYGYGTTNPHITFYYLLWHVVPIQLERHCFYTTKSLQSRNPGFKHTFPCFRWYSKGQIQSHRITITVQNIRYRALAASLFEQWAVEAGSRCAQLQTLSWLKGNLFTASWDCIIYKDFYVVRNIVWDRL